MNIWRIDGVPDERLPAEDELEHITLAIASGEMPKSSLTAWFEQIERHGSQDTPAG